MERSATAAAARCRWLCPVRGCSHCPAATLIPAARRSAAAHSTFAGTAALSSTGILTIQSGGEVVLDDLLGAAAPSTAESESAAAGVTVDDASTSAVSGTASTGGISALLARIRAAQAAMALLPDRRAVWLLPRVRRPCPRPPPSSCWLSLPSQCSATPGGGSGHSVSSKGVLSGRKVSPLATAELCANRDLAAELPPCERFPPTNQGLSGSQT